MVDALNNQSPPYVPAANRAASPVPARAPGLAPDGRAVSPEARARAARGAQALEALANYGNTNDGAPDPSNIAVDLTPYDHHSSFWASPTLIRLAQRELAANRPAERAALAKMPPERAAAFEQVRGPIAQDPMAERALQQLLLAGSLDTVDLTGEGNLLAHLDRIATQQNARGVDRRELLRTLVRELADPNAISQGDGDIGTCVATTATIAAAYRNPAEVARIVAGLASANGKVALQALPGDDTPPVLERPANWNVDTHGYGGQRSPSVKLMQPALMNYALRANLAHHRAELPVDPDELNLLYDPRTDAFTPSGTPDQVKNGGIAIDVWKKLNEGGLDNHQGNTLLEHLTGGRYTPFDVDARNREEVFKRVAAAAKAGFKVPVGVTYKEDGHTGGHQMMVHSYDATRGKFRVTDPIDGGIHYWSAAKLKAAITDANIPAT